MTLYCNSVPRSPTPPKSTSGSWYPSVKVSLRPANMHEYSEAGSDCRKQFEWRNKPEVYQGLYTQGTQNKPLEWKEHVNWWLSRRNWQFLVIQADGVDVGMITLGQLDSWCPQIGVYVGETRYWGQGIGKKAVELGLAWFKGHDYGHVQTTILKSNERSLRLFLSLGFIILRDGRPGEHWVYKEL